MAHSNENNSRKQSWFTAFAHQTSCATGSPAAFMLACAVIVIWVVSGPVFKYSDTWQLVINTGTTIITFLMVFLIQNTQNRDSKMIHLKLDELIRAINDAEDEMIDMDTLSETELETLHKRYTELAKTAHTQLSEKSRGKRKAESRSANAG